jgi:hypothetical protein
MLAWRGGCFNKKSKRFNTGFLPVVIVFVFLSYPVGASAQSNLGKQFCIQLPNGYKTTPLNYPLNIIYIVSPRPTAVTVEYAGVAPYRVNVNYIEKIIISDTGTNYGFPGPVFITADDSVAVIASKIFHGLAMLYNVVPLERWGRSYRVPPCVNDTIHGGTFDGTVVAEYDSTKLAISDSLLQIIKTPLMRGDVYSLGGGARAGHDPKLIASKPVGLLQDMCTSLPIIVPGERNIQWDIQMQPFSPIASWGRDFYTIVVTGINIPSDGNNNDLLHVTAEYDSTMITIDADTTFRLDGGKFAIVHLPEGFHHVHSTKRIEILQKGSFDESFLVPPVEQYLRDIYFFCPYDLWDTAWGGKARNYISLIHPALNIDSVTLDGVSIGSMAQGDTIGADSSFMEIQMAVSRGFHHLHSTDRFMAAVYGNESYQFRHGDDDDTVLDGDGDDILITDTECYSYCPVFGGTTDMIGGAAALDCGLLNCRYHKDTSFVIENLGIDTLRIDSVKIIGPDSEAFSILTPFPVFVPVPDYANGMTDDTTLISVRYTPRHPGISAAILLVYSNDTTGTYPYVVAVTGKKDSVGLAVDRSLLDFGKVPVCNNDTAITLTFTNTGTVPINGQMYLYGRPAFYNDGVLRSPLDTGKSTSVTVHFTHQADSIYAGTIVVYTLCDSIVIPMHGEGVMPKLSLGNMDFGSVCGNMSVVRYISVMNTGDTSATITSANISAPFAVDSPAIPFVVRARDSVSLRVHFAPQSDGKYSKVLQVSGDPCSVSAIDTLTGERGTPVLIASNADFGNICLGDSARDTVMLYNRGNASLAITSVLAAPPFSLQTLLPVTIAEGDSQKVVISYVPTSIGTANGNITYSGSSCYAPAKTQITGVGVSVALSASDVDLGTVTASGRKDSVIIIRNAGADAATVRLQTVAPFSIDSATVTIAGGDSVTIGVHYLPTKTGNDSANVFITTSVPCSAAFSIELHGRDTASIITDLQNAQLCATTPDPVGAERRLDMNIDLLNDVTVPVDSVTFDLQYDPTALLLPGVSSPRCRVEKQAIKLGDTRIALSNCGAPLAAGELCNATFFTLVNANDTTHTSVNIANIVFYPAGSVQGAGCAIPITILPLCGLHGVFYIGATSLAQNYPNPFTGTTAIHVTLSQSDAQSARLVVCNVLGEQVADLTDQLSANGDVTFKAGANKAGVYYYVLETASGRITRQMFVVK